MSGAGTFRDGVATWLGRWCLFMLLWLALTDTRKVQELIAGAVVASIATWASGLLIRPGRPRTFAKSGELLRLGTVLVRPLARLVLDTGIVARAVWARIVRRRPVRGSFRAAHYRPQGPRRSAAGRTVTEIWGSLAANRYVVGIDDEHGTILVHELLSSDEPIDPLASR